MEDIDIKQLDDAVRVIKSAILRAQTKAVKSTNATLLSLYYGIGRFVSINSRSGFWGTGAIKAISEQLQNELPGLRGFSEENIKKMRSFYEKWEGLTNRSPMATDLQILENKIQNGMEVGENSLLVKSVANGDRFTAA